MAILLSEYANNVDINLLKVVKMLLIHDLVEIDAGDTFAYDITGNMHKEKREREAATRIFGILPEDQNKELLSLWEEFESMLTPEARFASALDKLQPLILSYNNKGWSWKKHGVASKQIIESKKNITKGSEDLWDYAKSLIRKSIDAGFLAEG